MLPVQQDYIGSLCEIKSLSNDLYMQVKIIKIDHDALEFAAKDQERIMLLQYRVPVKIFVYNQKLGNQVLVGLTYLSTDNFLRLEDVRQLSDFERRAAFRVNTGVAGTLSRLISDKEHKEFTKQLENATPEEAEKMLSGDYLEVKIMDVSLIGVRIATPKKLKINDKYILEFAPHKETMTFCIQVKRIIHINGIPDQYGCVFFDFSERQMDSLCRDLFQLQRIEKKRRQNTSV